MTSSCGIIAVRCTGEPSLTICAGSATCSGPPSATWRIPASRKASRSRPRNRLRALRQSYTKPYSSHLCLKAGSLLLPDLPSAAARIASPWQRRLDAEEVRRTSELDDSCRNAQHAQALHHAQHDLASLLFAQMAKQFDRAEPGECGSDEEPCQQGDAAIGSNSNDGKDGPDREKVLRMSYARGQRNQGRESRAHIGPLLISRLLLPRQP